MKAMGAVGRGRWMLPALLFWAATGAPAYDGPVEKKIFTLPMYTTVGGKTSDPDELEAVAREARKLRPTAKIFLRSPFGQVVEFDPVE